MWINPIDAKTRGIVNGDRIRIFNDRGEVHIEAKVTPRMMPRVFASIGLIHIS
ncbi:molybdopterin dinucleotide binding domain-containing protein [Klebsiella aerogenes]|uniref:molybdopterin dinucleotide binding domain-containing protein n=1 Tax=Klebsiella aerogenes TaxID=548 RepID=UPI0038778F58